MTMFVLDNYSRKRKFFLSVFSRVRMQVLIFTVITGKRKGSLNNGLKVRGNNCVCVCVCVCVKGRFFKRK